MIGNQVRCIDDEIPEPWQAPELPIYDCPFCGNDATPNRDWQSCWVECDTCGTRGKKFRRVEIDKAIAFWNERKK